MLEKWLFSGELQDPFGEFFVAVNPDLAHFDYLRPRTADGSSLVGDGGFARISSEDILNENASSAGIRLWEEKYMFKKEMLPRYVGETFGKRVSVFAVRILTILIFFPQIFSTGKSLNFIRYSCHDSDWVGTRNKLTSTGRGIHPL